MKKSLFRTLICLVTVLAILSAVFLFFLLSKYLLSPLNQDPETVYGSLLDEYAVLLQSHADGEDVTAVEAPTTKGLSQTLFESLKTIVSAMPETEFENADDMGYAFRDLDGDGVYECFLMKKDGTLYALYACKNGKPYPVETYREGTHRQGILLDDGTVYTLHIIKKDDKLVSDEYRFSRFKDGAMEPYLSYIVNYEKNEGYIIENGETRVLTPEENNSKNEYVTDLHYAYSRYTKEAGLRFCSLLGEKTEPDPNVPVFDASSYEAVLQSLSSIASLIDGFDSNLWLYGEYDNLMQTDSPEEFELYNHLVYAAGQTGLGANSEYATDIGYAYKDLNGDGTNELFIMTDENDLLAIFTLRDGTPTLLYRNYGNGWAWLDIENRLLVARYTNRNYSGMEYIRYELTDENTLRKTSHIWSDQYVKKMLIDGKMTVIDRETFVAEKRQVFNMEPGEIWTNDWNKDGKMLTFTPLPEADK